MIYRDIKGYEGLYKISEYGDVLSIRTNAIMSPWISNKGYKCIDLVKDGTKKHYLIHRLVAEAFIPNPNNYPIVLHLDNNKLNIHYSNLKYGTYSENNAQCIADGLNKVPTPDNRKTYCLSNGINNYYFYGQKSIVDAIGYGNVGITQNIINRHSKIKQGPYKGYTISNTNHKIMASIIK